MAVYKVLARRADGSFAFGATLRFQDDTSAIAKFHTLPLSGLQAELLRGNRRVAFRPAESEGRARTGSG